MGMSGPERADCVSMCMYFHKSTTKASEEYLRKLQRYYHVTPTLYLGMIKTFIRFLKEKRESVLGAKQRYETGLEKLMNTEVEVQKMQEELKEMQPVLVETTKETEEMMVVVAKEAADAEKIQSVVQAEEEKANAQAEAAQAIKDDCEAQLAEAMPILEAAIAALNTLQKSDITEVKSMKSPPDGVRLTMEAVCILCGVKPTRGRDPNNPSKVVFNYWDSAKKELLGDPKFLQNLIKFDKDNIPKRVMDKIRPFISNLFELRRSQRLSLHMVSAARAIFKYDGVAKVVEPKRQALAKAEASFTSSCKGLQRSELSCRSSHKVDGLRQKLDDMKRRKNDLKRKSSSADKNSACGKAYWRPCGEKSRWTAVAHDLGEQYTRVTGDMLLAAATVSYAGVFTAAFRKEITRDWTKVLQESVSQ